jgi:hypothetical protein
MILAMGLVLLALWDANMNLGRLTKPVIYFIYRVAGGY